MASRSEIVARYKVPEAVARFWEATALIPTFGEVPDAEYEARLAVVAAARAGGASLQRVRGAFTEARLEGFIEGLAGGAALMEEGSCR